MNKLFFSKYYTVKFLGSIALQIAGSISCMFLLKIQILSEAVIGLIVPECTEVSSRRGIIKHDWNTPMLQIIASVDKRYLCSFMTT